MTTWLSEIPESPAIYMFQDLDGMALYIGASTNVRKRIISHLQSFSRGENTDALQNYVHENGRAFEIHILKVCSSVELEMLETEYINLYKPRLNQRIP